MVNNIKSPTTSAKALNAEHFEQTKSAVSKGKMFNVSARKRKRKNPFFNCLLQSSDVVKHSPL